MFGRNGKISERQIRRILILEQAAKIGLLLPLLAQIPEGGFSIWSWILTAALTFLYLKIMLDFSKKLPEYPATDRKTIIENRAADGITGTENQAAENRTDGTIQKKTGQTTVTILAAVYLIYGFADVFFLLCLFAEAAQCFLLPEQKIWMLILPAAAVCSFAADHRLEVRAKFLEVLCPILTFPVMLLLLVLAVLTIRGGQFGTLGEMMRPSAPGSIWIAGIAMLSVFAGLGSDVFLQRATKEQQSRSVFEKTTGSMLIGSLLLLFLLQAVFGAGGIRALPFSVITAMSNFKIRGIFLQRWDVLFAVFFLGMVCGALVSGFSVLGTCSERLLPGKKKKWKWWLMAAAASAAACVSPSYEKSVQLYELVSLGFLGITMLVALLKIIRKIHCK